MCNEFVRKNKKRVLHWLIITVLISSLFFKLCIRNYGPYILPYYGPYLLPCNNGPYIWDKSKHETGHKEGIGSTFQWTKPTFIATHILNGSWIGNLTNSHDEEGEEQSVYFGLYLSHCDERSLEIHEFSWIQQRFQLHTHDENRMHTHDFISVRKDIDFDSLNKELKNSTVINNTTVLVFDWERLDEKHNYAVFDAEFRKRFHLQRLKRQTPKREIYEQWVTIHFRWGDVATDNPEHSNIRNGLEISGHCSCIKKVLEIHPQAKVFFLAENFMHTNSCDVLNSERVHLSRESKSWQMAIDVMSQSQLLIGGDSSFFVLGAHLCERCIVLHSSSLKFQMSKNEQTLPKHITEFRCASNLSCYFKHIRNYFEYDLFY